MILPPSAKSCSALSVDLECGSDQSRSIRTAAPTGKRSIWAGVELTVSPASCVCSRTESLRTKFVRGDSRAASLAGWAFLLEARTSVLPFLKAGASRCDPDQSSSIHCEILIAVSFATVIKLSSQIPSYSGKIGNRKDVRKCQN